MINALKTALYTKVTGATNSFDTSIGSRFYYRRVPANKMPPSYPYCVYFFPSPSLHHITMGRGVREEIEEVLVHFNIFDDDESSSDLGTTYSNFISLFTDDITLSVSGYTLLSMVREWENFGEWDDDTQSYVTSVRYRIKLQKN